MIGKTNCYIFSQMPKGNSISELAEGTLIKIKENGNPVEFYVTKHNYESELNGEGRTLVVRKDCYDQRQWHSDYVNAWASSAMLSWLNSGYLSLFSSKVQDMIGSTKYYYTLGNGNSTVTSRADAVFMLSLTEFGQSLNYANVEGSALPIASILKLAYQNGNATTQWTRTPYTMGTNYAWALYANGSVDRSGCATSFGSRPCFTLPSTALVDSELNLIEEESSPVTGTTLADLAEGTLIKIPENGVPVEFYLAKHDYEPGLNGDGRQLIVRKDCYDLRQWNSVLVNTYSTSDIDSWFNSGYIGFLDPGLVPLIGTTKFYYTPGNGNNTLATLERAIFCLSFTELGKQGAWSNIEGSPLPDNIRYQIALLNGVAVSQWSRSPDLNYTNSVCFLDETGSFMFEGGQFADLEFGSRPCFTLPADVRVDDDLNIIVA